MSNTLLHPIFSSFRANPNGAATLEFAISKAFTSAIQAVESFRTPHGVMITSYDPGFYADKSEKNIKYQLSMPQQDIAEGYCVCTVGNKFAQTLMGGGYTPSKRPIVKGDQVVALVICINKYDPFYPTTENFYQQTAQELNIKIYVYEPIHRKYWVLDGESKQPYLMS